jgi:hypothetical protein
MYRLRRICTLLFTGVAGLSRDSTVFDFAVYRVQLTPPVTHQQIAVSPNKLTPSLLPASSADNFARTGFYLPQW